jgi:hypothetical protein
MLKYFIYLQDHIGCVMVSMLILNVVDLGSNTLSWIFIVLAHWNNSLQVDMSLNPRHIILILSQPVFALTP